MTKELLQQCLDALIESRDDVDLCYAGVKAARLSFRQERQLGFYEEQLVKHDAAIEGLKQALAQQEQCGCREGECETKKDKTCRMTIEIAERDGIPEWTPAIGIECAISSLRDDAARLRDGSYTPLQIADDLDVIANDLAKCKPDAQQEQPASVDAYVGAREDAAIWKKRALEAEELNRKFIAELNGPTYLGEPVKQEQPAQEPVVAHPIGFDYLDSGQLVATYALPVEGKNHPKLYTHPAPTQPALTLDKLIDMAVDANLGRRMRPIMWKAGDVFYTDASYRTDELEVFARAIEAHCRGGATS